MLMKQNVKQNKVRDEQIIVAMLCLPYTHVNETVSNYYEGNANFIWEIFLF